MKTTVREQIADVLYVISLSIPDDEDECDNLSEEAKQKHKDAVGLMAKYIAGKIKGSECLEKLKGIYNALEAI